MKESTRCSWCLSSDLYKSYHDTEWGVPVHDDRTLFEYLILEGAQAGLSWITVLNKRETYREAFDNFDAIKIATYDENKRAQLLQNPGIIRNKLKVNAAIVNAKVFLALQREYGSFDAFIWKFSDHKVIQNHYKTLSEVPATTDLSDSMSKELKKLGFKFIGSTICYAFMQAIGMVNDHITTCFRHNEVKNLS